MYLSCQIFRWEIVFRERYTMRDLNEDIMVYTFHYILLLWTYFYNVVFTIFKHEDIMTYLSFAVFC